jgi:hypothetical protein
MPRRPSNTLAAAALAGAALLLVASPLTADAWATKPWFCHELDCPQYEVLENLTSIGVEVRRYAATRWVETTIENATSVAGPAPARSSAGAQPSAASMMMMFGGGAGGAGGGSARMGSASADEENASTGYERAVAAGFYKLFRYISGDNLTGAKIAMTAPVKVWIKPAGPTCGDSFTVGFFIAPNVTTPPPPTDASVKLTSWPSSTVYAHGFSGWATGATYVERARSVAAALEGLGRTIASDEYGTAGYDSPFRLRNRHNEVWIPAVEEAPMKKAAVMPTKAAAKPAMAATAKAAAPAAPKAKPAAALKVPTTTAAKN